MDPLTPEAEGRPTLHVTNWSSTGLHGPGPRLTIMAAPRSWEHGDGRVDVLLPKATDLRAAQAGTLSPDAYRAAFEAKMEQALLDGSLRPHVGLMYNPAHRLAATGTAAAAANATSFSVESGSTLCCACSKQKAAEGRCHRVWAAQALARAGWSVILDGVRVEDPKRGQDPDRAYPRSVENTLFQFGLRRSQ